MNFGTLHFQILHFPIALILAAALAELLALITRRDFFADAGKYCILGAALMAIPTVLAGDALADEMAARTPSGGGRARFPLGQALVRAGGGVWPAAGGSHRHGGAYRPLGRHGGFRAGLLERLAKAKLKAKS